MSAEGELIDFGVTQVKAIGEQLMKLTKPASGSTTWYNGTDHPVSVETFDEEDAVRLVRYEERVIAPRQVVLLTARGNIIHVKVKENGFTYDSKKGSVYLYNGQNLYPKKN